MRLLLAIAAGFLALSSAASAETLPISGIYPAGYDEAAGIQSIAVENFGGSDGPALSLKIEDLLRDVYIQRKAWFAVMPASGGANADAILRGNATADVRRENIKLTRRRCVQKDEDKKCIEYKDVEAECIRRTVTLNYQVRLVRWQGELVYRADGAPTQQLEYCPKDDDGVKTIEKTVTELLDPIATNTRYALAPYQVVRDHRILETRKGLKGPVNDAFKAAIALIKKNPAAACDAWEALGVSLPDNAPVEFNRGLCAEMNGQFDIADAHYVRALQLAPKTENASDGRGRIASRRHADRQLAEHWGN